MKLKLVVASIFILLLTSCAYNYRVGIEKNAQPSSYAIIKFDNRYKVSAIDGEKFSRNPSIWVDGSHTVKLPPGMHSFTLRYSDVNMNSGGNYTTEDSVVSADMEAGKIYEIKSEFGSRIVRFFIVESNGAGDK